MNFNNLKPFINFNDLKLITNFNEKFMGSKNMIMKNIHIIKKITLCFRYIKLSMFMM